MKIILRISLILNLGLIGGLIFLLSKQHQQIVAPSLVSPKAAPLQVAVPPSHEPTRPTGNPSGEEERAKGAFHGFRWNDLISQTSYRTFIANLRAVGCPEPTVEDIVRGDADRAFAWKRSQLGLDDSGNGPWSQKSEMKMVASLLGLEPPPETTTLAQAGENPAASAANAPETAAAAVLKAASPSYPLFLQNVDWKALGFTTEQQTAIAQVRQQFTSATANLNQNAGGSTSQNSGAANANDATSPNNGAASPDPNDSAALTQWQNALQDADGQLRDFMGAQAYMAYEQQQYYVWFKSQLAAGGGNF